MSTCVRQDSFPDAQTSSIRIIKERVSRGFPAIDRQINGGAEEDRTPDLLLAKQALSRLSYGPVRCGGSEWI